MDRATLLDRVMHNYRRFYSRKALFHYPWRGTGLPAALPAGLPQGLPKAGFERQFYDLGKHNYWGPQSKEKVVFNFDRTRTIAKAQMEDWQSTPGPRRAETRAQAGAGHVVQDAQRRPADGSVRDASRARPSKACGGGDQQMLEPAE
jgi:anaerobic magnesium-protoporphyrin IX monomethyl ester cyclase